MAVVDVDFNVRGVGTRGGNEETSGLTADGRGGCGEFGRMTEADVEETAMEVLVR